MHCLSPPVELDSGFKSYLGFDVCPHIYVLSCLLNRFRDPERLEKGLSIQVAPPKRLRCPWMYF
jgi:hypothetical protein